jgi:hypothetical protein
VAALLWYLAIGFGLPLADGFLYHDQDSAPRAHIEAAGAECHRGECSLEAPGAPQSPAGGPVDTPATIVVTFAAVDPAALYPPRSRSIARAHAPRAPPTFA